MRRALRRFQDGIARAPNACFRAAQSAGWRLQKMCTSRPEPLSCSVMRAQETFHLIGIGGVGMSALAQLLLALGRRVSGSDRFWDQGVPVPALDVLRRAGAVLCQQDGSGITDSDVTVVVSTAIEEDNADLQKARSMGCRVAHRAELLAELAKGRRMVAVTGTSGKTTVTGMIGWILTMAGWDPTVVNGGAVVGWGNERQLGSVRAGGSDWWVLEADESDKSLLRFAPHWAVITNMSCDHFGLDETREVFRRFSEKAERGVILGPAAASLGADIKSWGPSKTVAVAEPFSPERKNGQWFFSLEGRSMGSGGFGRHNAENAFVAAVTCRRLGVPIEVVGRALETFPGIERRLQIVGRANEITVIDDYAHNPAKIEAAWAAVAERYRRVLGAWRPHGFAPLRNNLAGLAEAFLRVCREDDRVFILPVFYAGGTADRRVSSDDLAGLLRERGVAAQVAADYDALRGLLLEAAQPGDVVLFMGARDPMLPMAAQQMVEALAR
jgi:UDP-N-acetylmuramate--alanine ligase